MDGTSEDEIGNNDSGDQIEKDIDSLMANSSKSKASENIDKLENGVDKEISSKDSVNTHRPVLSMLPRVDCPEKIIICLDLSAEMKSTMFSSRSGDKFSSLELARRSIRMFVLHKIQMNPNHEFCLLIFHDTSVVIQNFTNKVKDVLATLDDSEMDAESSEPLNMAEMFQTIKETVSLPALEKDSHIIPPPYIVRVLLVYGRSHSIPACPHSDVQKELEASPYFFTDVLYIHKPPDKDNDCEEIFGKLCELDHSGLSYIFEVSKYTPILNSAAKLLAHPLQRPKQSEASYKIGTSPTKAQVTMEDNLI